MLYTIKNEYLTVVASDAGAELQSVTDRDGEERLWQGDPAYWGKRAPILFPFCGRVWNNLATVNGVPCNPGMHGFFRGSKTVLEEQTDSSLTFLLTDSPETLAKYPFRFEARVIYRLCDDTVTVSLEVTNTDSRTMYYGYGAHPGFRMPYAGGEAKDYYLQFPNKEGAQSLRFDPMGHYPIGGSDPLGLVDGDKLYLDGEHFIGGSAVLCDMPKEVTLATALSDKRVTVSYPDFPYLTLWRDLRADFICIEPWCSLPAAYQKSTELTEKPDLVSVGAGQTNTHTYTVRCE